MTSRPSAAAPILAVLAVVLPFALYVAGYFWLGERVPLKMACSESILVTGRPHCLNPQQVLNQR
jgi:hypothetical protein